MKFKKKKITIFTFGYFDLIHQEKAEFNEIIIILFNNNCMLLHNIHLKVNYFNGEKKKLKFLNN